VPDVLLSGDHRKIAEWRAREGERLTREQHTRERLARDAGEG
jgi:tRNA G37 N-methylase TrmD